MHINDHVSGKKHHVTDDEIEVAVTNAIFAYEQRALKPLLDELFYIPYLADYVKKEEYISDTIAVARQRRV